MMSFLIMPRSMFHQCLNELCNDTKTKLEVEVIRTDNGVVPEMNKALDNDNRKIFYNFVADFLQR